MYLYSRASKGWQTLKTNKFWGDKKAITLLFRERTVDCCSLGYKKVIWYCFLGYVIAGKPEKYIIPKLLKCDCCQRISTYLTLIFWKIGYSFGLILQILFTSYMKHKEMWSSEKKKWRHRCHMQLKGSVLRKWHAKAIKSESKTTNLICHCSSQNVK